MQKNVIIGVTGLYCAGKNHISRLLEKRGLPVLDLDKLGHEVIRRETETIVRRFGREVLDAEGFPDRRLLGKAVFGRPEELAALEAIIHPVVNCLTGEWTASQTGPCVINAALLHRSSAYSRLNALMVIRSPLPVRFFRAKRRDKLSPRELVKRLFSQKDFPRYRAGKGGTQLFFCPADTYIIQNSGFPGSAGGLEKRIDAILEGLCYGNGTGKTGKEKTTIGGGFGGSISGDCVQRSDSVLF
jgi:dephospho-CoA kinase